MTRRNDQTGRPTRPAWGPVEASVQYLTLEQLAVAAQVPLDALQQHAAAMPPPSYPGRRGRPSLWGWHKVRNWLAKQFNRPRLPRFFPGAPPEPVRRRPPRKQRSSSTSASRRPTNGKPR